MSKSVELTLITTGTGSGKTESFLIPVLDHCQRAKRTGATGIKAILLYPMNARATDQPQRINELLTDPALRQVTAGLYIGDVAAIEYPHVMTKRSEMRCNPPDVLITNTRCWTCCFNAPTTCRCGRGPIRRTWSWTSSTPTTACRVRTWRQGRP